MDSDGSTPLAFACQSGDEAMSKLLIDAGANVNTTVRPVLIEAALRGNVNIVNWLIGAGAEVDATLKGATALSQAACKGHLDVVKALLESGAGINVQDVHGSSPLSEAAKEGREPVVRLLLENKAEVDTVNWLGRSPLSFAAGSGLQGCIDLLLDAGAVVGMEDVDGMTPSSWARRNGHEVIANLLLEKENRHKSEQTQAAGHKDETDVKIAPRSKSEDGDGWPGRLADVVGQDNSRSRWRKTNLAKSFEMTDAS